jgi:hypothetical protein
MADPVVDREPGAGAGGLVKRFGRAKQAGGPFRLPVKRG